MWALLSFLTIYCFSNFPIVTSLVIVAFVLVICICWFENHTLIREAIKAGKHGSIEWLRTVDRFDRRTILNHFKNNPEERDKYCYAYRWLCEAVKEDDIRIDAYSRSSADKEEYDRRVGDEERKHAMQQRCDHEEREREARQAKEQDYIDKLNRLGN